MFKRTKRLIAAATLLANGAIAGTCYADSKDTNPGSPVTGGSGDTFMMLLKVIFFLGIIIGLFFVIMKVVAKKNRSFQASRSIKSLGGLGLGTNKSVQLVQIGNSLLVLGVGEDISLIQQIDDPEEIQYIIDRIQPNTAEFKGFPSMGEWLKRITKRQEKSEELDVTPSFQMVFQEKMQRIANRQKKVREMMDRDNDSDGMKESL